MKQRNASIDDLDLAKQIAKGDVDVAERFVRDFYDPAYRFLRHLTRHVEESEDLAQLTLLRACKNMHVYDGRASLKTWVLRIAFHEYAKWKRRQLLRFRVTDTVSSPEPGFDEIVIGDWLLRELAQIPEKQRIAFLLIEIQEISLREAAQVLGVPVGTVKSRLHSAKQKLQASFIIEQGENKYGPKVVQS